MANKEVRYAALLEQRSTKAAAMVTQKIQAKAKKKAK
jgi:hypothetical protein